MRIRNKLLTTVGVATVLTIASAGTASASTVCEQHGPFNTAGACLAAKANAEGTSEWVSGCFIKSNAWYFNSY